MVNIVDRRKSGGNKSAPNRKKFIDRYKKHIKKSVHDIAIKKSMKDFLKDSDVTIDKDTISQPTISKDHRTGEDTVVVPGNDKYSSGDSMRKPNSGGKGRGASNSGEGEDEFRFKLTKEEFLDLYFEDLELPSFIKKGIKKAIDVEFKRAGFSKTGIPARLNIKKTFENAIARKIVAKSQGKKARFLDDEDIRYDYFTKLEKPKRHAVMICIMDVSGSMGEHEKTMAKKFFLLLYIFLHKEYESIELVFIRHTTHATEVNEEDFFNARETGGTIISSAYELANEIITTRYDVETTNLYISQASDGENWNDDNDRAARFIEGILLPKIQYLAYLEVRDSERKDWGAGLLYERIQKMNNKKIGTVVTEDPKYIYKALRDLFKKEGN